MVRPLERMRSSMFTIRFVSLYSLLVTSSHRSLDPLAICLPTHSRSLLSSNPTTHLNQPVPIPSYIIAIASGNLIYKPFPSYPSSTEQTYASSSHPWKTGVWTEPELMEKSYWEFEKDTARYVHEAESLITPYEFGVYDLLVLPPSFPYGGM